MPTRIVGLVGMQQGAQQIEVAYRDRVSGLWTVAQWERESARHDWRRVGIIEYETAEEFRERNAARDAERAP